MRPEWSGLRGYQGEALEAVAARRVPRAIVAIATGGGKGHLAGHLTEALSTERVLYMVHRDTLIRQLETHIKRIVRGFVGVEMGAERAGPMAATVIASVQTLAAGGGRRLRALVERGFDALVIDEAHHATAETYCRVQAALGLLRPGDTAAAKWLKTDSPTVAHVGLTATPGRGDGVGLHLVYDEIVYQRDLRTLVRSGWLVPPIAYAIDGGADLDGVRTLGKRGDYIESDLERVINTEERNGALFDGWAKSARGKRTLVFCGTVAHAKALAEHFLGHGEDARSIDGGMSGQEREAVYRWYAATPGAVLTSCQLIGEGVDLPHVEAVLMARPTRSLTVYAQAIGRGTRLAAGARDYGESVTRGKAHCLVLDVCDSVSRLGKAAMRIGDLLGLPWPDEAANGEDVIDLLEAQEVRQREEIRIRDRSASLRAVQLMDSSGLPAHFGLAWLQTGSAYLLPLPDGGVIRLATDTLDRWHVERQAAEGWAPIPTLAADARQERIVGAAEGWYRATYPGLSLALVDRSAGWRSRPPSEKVLWLARKLKVRVPTGADAGQVSDLVNAAKAARGEVTAPRERPTGAGPCPECAGPTREVTGRYGTFYSCARYPDCRGTRQAEVRA